MKEQYIKINKCGEYSYIKINKYGKFYYSDEEKTILHREDGPAVELVSGFKSWWINGKRHREDGPAIEWDTGDREWFINGLLHREDGPAVEWSDGDESWFINGEEYTKEEFNKIINKNTVKEQYIKIKQSGNKYYYSDKKMTCLHREDGPAIELKSGTKCWYINGKMHREDGPAFEWFNGFYKEWWVNGKRHREDGPAIEYSNGDKSWWINGKRYKEEFNKITKKSLELTMDEIAAKFGVSVENLKIKK